MSLLIPQADRAFSDILMCQVEPTGTVANVKDLFLPEGGATTPMFDSSVVSKIICISHFCPSNCFA